MAKINPFTPNNPASYGMFVGRKNELDAFDKSLTQTTYSNPSHLLLLGERGIGKTSLLNAAQIFACGEFPWGDEAHNFLTIRIPLSENLCLADFAVNLKLAIDRELCKHNIAVEILNKGWKFISRFEAGGIAYRKEESSKNDAQLIQDMTYSLIDTTSFLRNPKSPIKKDGLVILLDEVDKASPDLHLGSFLKNLSEALVSERKNYILFILTGLPEARDVLMRSHESSLRLFQEHYLKPLSREETDKIIQKGLEQAKKTSGQSITIDEPALDMIHEYSEGYPHFVQQIGASVFDIDTDNIITTHDVIHGFFMPNGALEQIGNRYYVKPFYKDISVDSQREILTIMSEKWTDWVSREQIKEKFKGTETTLSNGIKALIDKNIIVPRDGARGQYKLLTASFAFWIKNHDKNKQRN